jgi:negative regulator of replication initiation
MLLLEEERAAALAQKELAKAKRSYLTHSGTKFTHRSKCSNRVGLILSGAYATGGVAFAKRTNSNKSTSCVLCFSYPSKPLPIAT